MSNRSIPHKTCTKCGKEYPLTPEYFNRDRSKATGLHPHCKSCIAKSIKAKNLANPQANRDRARKWALDNPEKYAANMKQWYQENREYVKAKSREYYRLHKKAHKINNGRWARKNPVKIRLYVNHRRAKKRGASGMYNQKDLIVQFRSQRGKCWHCGGYLEDDYHIDHLIPLAKGGSNDARNIVLSCPTCNMSKGAKLTQEWNGRLF